MNEQVYTKAACESDPSLDNVFVAAADVTVDYNKCLSYNNLLADGCSTSCLNVFTVDCGSQAECDEHAPSSLGLVIGILIAIIGCVAIGILVYCFCCKNKNDDGYHAAR